MSKESELRDCLRAGEVFAVEECDGEWQTVYPSCMAQYSCRFTYREDAVSDIGVCVMEYLTA